jgi:lipopolysaccharide heptosyltransferase I
MMPAMAGIDPYSRILIVRLSAIGDVLHGLPVANSLRDALPRAFLAWVVEDRCAELLRGHRALDELAVIPRGWLKSPANVWGVRRQLRQLRFDITIDLQGLTKSAAAAWLSGARRRIGFDGVDGRELSRWLNNQLILPTRTHVVDRNLELLGALGIDRPTVRFDLADALADAATAERIVQTIGSPERFAVINPGAGWPSKLWPANRYAAVAKHLGEARGVRSIVVWAGKQERAWAEEIVFRSGGHTALAPPTTLRELAAIARCAALFVSADTGPLHLAVAVGTPSVGLFGPVPAARNGPYGPQHVSVQRICLQGKSRERRSAGPESMEAISIDDVIAACERILDRAAAKRSA